PTYTWNEHYLAEGRLLLPSVASEVRMRYWVLTADHPLSVPQVLRMALERCLPFRIEVPTSVAESFAPQPLSNLERRAATFYQLGRTETLAAHNLTGYEYRDRYQTMVLELLSRPHARAFLFKGGIIARLAWEYGGLDLVIRAMQGPSVQVSHYSRGQVTHGDIRTTDDQVSEPEVWLLLGLAQTGARQTTDHWLWPPPELWEESGIFQGEWNERAEGWFKRIVRSFEEGKTRPMSTSDWKQIFRKETRRQLDHPPLTTASWRKHRGQLNRFSASWDNVTVASLSNARYQPH
ncbi:hypothetical protein PLICRDRAFT_101579, partial [Plicaturopsis crispa FD-325 SS-3]